MSCQTDVRVYLGRHKKLFENRLRYLKELAETETHCRRKGTGSGISNCFMDYKEDCDEYPIFGCEFINGSESSKKTCTNQVGSCGCIHAEFKTIHAFIIQNAECIINLDNVLYSVYSPCTSCANLISLCRIQDGSIDAVVHLIDTEHDMRGIDILRANGLLVMKVSDIQLDS